jgi:hypothetical protein
MNRKGIDQIVSILFQDAMEDQREDFQGYGTDFIPEVFSDCVEDPQFTDEEVHTVFYTLHKLGIFEPQDEKGNWWATSLYWKAFDEYHLLERRIEKDK